jgi:adenylate cyclase
MPHIVYHPEVAIDEEDGSLTLLAISRKHGIAHASACNGNARCSTCRVLVLEGLEHLTPRTEAESQLAEKKGFEAEIRLACQTRAEGSVTLRRLVLDACDHELAAADQPHTAGREATLAVLFSDIRGFTAFAETHLPYDVVHILNRYFHCMGEAVLRHGGHIDKYMGDGLMALFGLDGVGPAEACRRAVRAGVDMLRELPVLNDYLRRHFDTEFAIGIGIHLGEVIVADLGHPRVMQFTAIGDPVNVASRVESATKEFGMPLLVSAAVAERLDDVAELGVRCRVPIRGKREPIELVQVRGLKANP